MRINEDILRFMTIRVEELEEGPSAMMRKRDRDDRDDRGDRGFGGPAAVRRPWRRRFGGGGGRRRPRRGDARAVRTSQ